jgi:hypothetical protein
MLGALLSFSACSTTELEAPTILPPAYTQVPHPEGYDLGSLKVLLQGSGVANDPEFVQNCDKDFNKLKSASNSTDELYQGVTELVGADPVHYHWCFYAKLNDLMEKVQSDMFIDEKQNRILDVFEFLVPVARAFMSSYHDSRYLRWAVKEYSKLSERLFYRKLELTATGVVQFVQPTNPFGVWKMPSEAGSVLEKYAINKNETAPSPVPSSMPSPGPSSMRVPLIAPEPDIQDLTPHI